MMNCETDYARGGIVLRISIPGLLLIASALFGQGATVDPARAAVDAVFEKWNNRTGPGAAVSVVRDGKVILERGYGMASLEYDAPITPRTIFHVASVSKQFTAMALVLLERDGKLTIDDDIHKYLPELPEYGKPVTIRQLLQHTSGIRDQWQTLGIAGWSLEDVITQEQILRVLFRQKELNFPPGSEHLYSNGGYTLAAEIVKRVSGKALPEFCAERIFGPLGMTRTHFHMDLRKVVPERSYSYSGKPGEYEASPLNYANVGATSLFTTATDLTKWLDNFREAKVGGKEAVSRMQEKAVLTDGKEVPYALGLAIGKYRGLPTVSHSGGDAGFRSQVMWFPEQKLGVAVVSNLGSFNPADAAGKVAAVYLGSQMTPVTERQSTPATATTARTYVTLDAAKLVRYAGTYPMSKLGQTAVISMDGGKLVLEGDPPRELKATSETDFVIESLGAELHFEAGADGGGMKVRVKVSGVTDEGERVDSKPVDLSAYSGVYWSEEVEAQYTVVEKSGALAIQHIRHGEIALKQTGPDRFAAGRWFMPEVAFLRGPGDGRVVALTLGGGRVKAIRFAKR